MWSNICCCNFENAFRYQTIRARTQRRNETSLIEVWVKGIQLILLPQDRPFITKNWNLIKRVRSQRQYIFRSEK